MIKELRHIQLHDMMSYLKAVVASLVLCFTIQGCDKEMGEPESTIDDNTIGFNAGVEKTRAVVGSISDVQNNGGFSVWGSYTNSDGTLQKVFNGENVYWQTASGSTPASWTYNETKYWNPGKTYNFFAVYPYATTNSHATLTQDGETYDGYQLTFTVPDNADTDLLTAYASGIEAKKDNAGNFPTVSFEFEHALAKVHFSVKKHIDNKLNKIVVKELTIGGVWATGTLSTSRSTNYTDSWDFSGSLTKSFLFIEKDGEDWTLESKDQNDENIVSPTNEGLLLMPQAIGQQKIPIYLKYEYYNDDNDPSPQRTISATAYLPIGEWETGNVYRYTIVLAAEDMDIKIPTPTVEPWGDDVPSGTIIIQ